MSDSNSKDVFDDVPQKQAQTTDFEALLWKAEKLMKSSDLDGALEQLLFLQEKYVAATRLFDMLGDAYMRGLDFRQGVRYKTLYEVLTSTLNAQKLARPAEGEPGPGQLALVGTDQLGEQPDREEPEAMPAPTTHLTAAMGQELLRQGHFEKALQVFDRLLAKNPQDEALLEAREKARRKSRERRLMGVLERWLHNIEHMKSGRSGGA
jgi:hypothetical protein